MDGPEQLGHQDSAAKEGTLATHANQAILAAHTRDVENSKKWAAGQNKQHSVTKNTAELDWGDTGGGQGNPAGSDRQSKALTQKTGNRNQQKFTGRCRLYESEQASPNQVLGKIERAITLKLWEDIGMPTRRDQGQNE